VLEGEGSSLALQIVVAVALLMLGRRLYWLFVAGVGFVVVMSLAGEYLDIDEGWVTMALAVAAGVVGALLAVFVQKLAVTLAGFAAAAYVAAMIAEEIGRSGQLVTVAVLVAGVLGGLLASFLFDRALILLSSLAGAALLVDALGVRHEAALTVMFVVAIAGMVIQINMLHRDRGSEAKAAGG